MTVAAERSFVRRGDRVVVVLVGVAVVLAALLIAAPPGDSGTEAGLAVAMWLGVATVIAISDAREHRIPNRLVAQLTLLSLFVLGLVEFVDTESSASVRSIVGASVASLIALVVHVITGGGLGMGDVKLMFPVVLVLGLFGSAAVWTALVAAVVLASLFIGARPLLRLGDGPVPLAPFLVVGTGLALVAA